MLRTLVRFRLRRMAFAFRFVRRKENEGGGCVEMCGFERLKERERGRWLCRDVWV
ncbi:hypothetical protein HanXRQr2_Chr05g0225371 [Helianthus annuus]|uniref:Uncharacterized protein n=1 Tax=Helianthus annuus TaxID=4232 RepID=A0A9K3J1E4_HELAN|nr:hypothetical protein HanXRQr2_Chr05g0225371 [Helianthus annuus]